jgi:hypothetical protein
MMAGVVLVAYYTYCANVTSTMWWCLAAMRMNFS